MNCARCSSVSVATEEGAGFAVEVDKSTIGVGVEGKRKGSIFAGKLCFLSTEEYLTDGGAAVARSFALPISLNWAAFARDCQFTHSKQLLAQ